MDISDPSSQAYKKARRQHLKTTRNRDSAIDLSWTPFRVAEKRYKVRFPPPDLSQVLDLAMLDEARADEVANGGWHGRPDVVELRELAPKKCCGVQSKVYTIPRIPGLVLLPAFVLPEEQRELVRWSLLDQARHPNDTNLDVHYNLPQGGLWNAYLQSRRDKTTETLVQPRFTTEPKPVTAHEFGPRKLIDNVPVAPDNVLSLSLSPKDPATPSPTIQASPPSALIPKLRWANIGWSYHWGSKQYDFTKGKGMVAAHVRDLCQRAVATAAWEQVFAEGDDLAAWGKDGPDWMTWDTTYEPDAGIVNFYQTKDTLMAHVDRSEVCATSPLVSISLGNAAIFLIGGVTRDVEPVEILLRSGDAIIMSGPACRRAFHGVPRILENTLPAHFQADLGSEWEPYREYMRTTRINVNVRQVFPRGYDPSVIVGTE